MSDENTVDVPETAKEKKTRKQYNVNWESFVDAWQASTTAQEAADKLGMPKNIVLARYALYKKSGAKLKKMERKNPRKLDIDALNRRIEGV